MESVMRPGPTTRARVREVSAGVVRDHRDDLATEEPLEIRIQAGEARRTLAITMRTPGHDFELAAGFLYGEGVITPQDVSSIAYCTDDDVPPEARYNTVTVRLRGGPLPDLPGLDRHFMTSSACGVCGTASLDALRGRCSPCPPGTTCGSPPKSCTACRTGYGNVRACSAGPAGCTRPGCSPRRESS